MDPRKFDALVQKLSKSLSRRSIVAGSLASLLTGATAVGLDDEALAKKDGRKARGEGKPKNRHDGAKREGKQGGRKKHNGAGGTEGKNNGQRGGKNVKGEGLACLANGQDCPKRTKRRPAKNGRKARFVTQGCDECCTRFSVSGVCSCRPTGTGVNSSCVSNGECCDGNCRAGFCRNPGPFLS